jgi:hypothetical protein
MMGALALMLAAGPRLGAAEEARTLPPAVYEKMTKGKVLSQVWIAPAFDRTKGFSADLVRSATPNRMAADAVLRVTEALGRLASPDAPNALSVAVVDMSVRERSGGSSVGLALEGQIQAADGSLLAAFVARQELGEPGTPEGTIKDLADRMVASLAKELGMTLRKPGKTPGWNLPATPGAEPEKSSAAGKTAVPPAVPSAPAEMAPKPAPVAAQPVPAQAPERNPDPTPQPSAAPDQRPQADAQKPAPAPAAAPEANAAKRQPAPAKPAAPKAPADPAPVQWDPLTDPKGHHY